MADHPRFGPAGVPPAFVSMKAPIADVPAFLRREGLDAFEYEAIYWGVKPQMKEQDAAALGLEAQENDIWLSMHGSYFMNLCGEKRIVEASKKRLVSCLTAAEWMKAHVVVFHPGFYGEKSPSEAFDSVSKALSDIAGTMKTLGIDNPKIGPETSGKVSQFGGLDEILAICEAVERAQLVIDWSHLHARDVGRFKTVEDFREVVERIENRLGSEAARNMHCHFTKIEFTEKGEKRHHVLDEEMYGPDFLMLAKVIADFKLRPVIISESPLLDLDAKKMRDMLTSLL